MQSGYSNVRGWLGIIISDKIFVDFSKYSPEESMSRLLKQIQLNKKNGDDELSQQALLVPERKINLAPKSQPDNLLNSNENEQVKKWTRMQVENWFNVNDMSGIYEFLGPMDGKDMYQLYQIKLHTPEFFFKSISEKVDLKKLITFSKLLMELF